MDKDKIIEMLKSLPQEFFENAYIISVGNDNPSKLRFQMRYDAELARVLQDANRWNYKVDINGFLDFERDDGLIIVMT